MLVRLLLPVTGLVSIYFLLRGHNAPGGGFVAGLIMASGVITQYMLAGTIWVESRLRIHPLAMIGIGLLSAATAGLSAWSASLPFLTALDRHVRLPWLGDIHVSTVLLFDVGVYLLVVGSTLLILVALAHQSLRRPRALEMR
jgi:multicomponent K+:H+ antiporter subunit A